LTNHVPPQKRTEICFETGNWLVLVAAHTTYYEHFGSEGILQIDEQAISTCQHIDHFKKDWCRLHRARIDLDLLFKPPSRNRISPNRELQPLGSKKFYFVACTSLVVHSWLTRTSLARHSYFTRASLVLHWRIIRASLLPQSYFTLASLVRHTSLIRTRLAPHSPTYSHPTDLLTRTSLIPQSYGTYIYGLLVPHPYVPCISLILSAIIYNISGTPLVYWGLHDRIFVLLNFW